MRGSRCTLPGLPAGQSPLPPARGLIRLITPLNQANYRKHFLPMIMAPKMHLFDGKALYAGCAPLLHPTDNTHLGHREGMEYAEHVEPVARRWAQFCQQLAQFATVCGRNWFAERNPVAFSE